MASLEELVGTISQVKAGAEELTSMVAMAATALKRQSGEISALGGSVSQSGRTATQRVSVAANGLDTAVASLSKLASECDTFVQDIRK
jgi:methyl-accepting chemotaxis protein